MISLWKPERPVSVVKVLPYFLDNLSDIINSGLYKMGSCNS